MPFENELLNKLNNFMENASFAPINGEFAKFLIIMKGIIIVLLGQVRGACSEHQHQHQHQ